MDFKVNNKFQKGSPAYVFLERFNGDLASLPQPFILAISGGRDSIFLLHLFYSLYKEGYFRAEPVVFHLHHGLRDSADGDMEFAAEMSRKFGFAFYLERRDASEFARRSKCGIEEAGRILRFRCLSRLVQNLGGCAVTGHHADDYLESVLIHLIRGAGIGAFETLKLFSTIHGVPLFRPLVFFSRAEIDRMLRDERISYREDETNSSDVFLRNRIRSSVLPALLANGLDPVRTWRNFHDDGISLTSKETCDRLKIDRSLFAPDRSSLKKLLDLCLDRLALPPASAALVEEIQKQRSRENFRLSYHDTDLFIWSSRRSPVWFFRSDAGIYDPFQVLHEEGSGDSVRVVYDGKTREYTLARGESVSVWKEGLVYGLSGKGEGGKKKVKKLYQELEIPPPVRQRLPILMDRDGNVKIICAGFWNDRDLTAALPENS